MSAETVREMLAAYIAGMAMESICDRFGVSEETVEAYRRAHGLRHRRLVKRVQPARVRRPAVAVESTPTEGDLEGPTPGDEPPCFSVPAIDGEWVCRRRKSDGAVIVRESREGEGGVPFVEAFRKAKREAKWRREIPATEAAS